MPHSAFIDAHQEDIDNAASIVWPAADGSTAMPSPNGGTVLLPLTCNAGDMILANHGTQFSYSSADGSVTLTFGSYLSGPPWQFTNAVTVGNNAATHPYQGPYCSIAPSAIDLTDEAFVDIEVLRYTDYVVDSYSGQLPTTAPGGGRDTSGGDAIQQGSIHNKHLTPTVAITGHFKNLSAQFSGGPGTYTLTFQKYTLLTPQFVSDFGTVTNLGTTSLSVVAGDWIFFNSRNPGAANPFINVPQASVGNYDNVANSYHFYMKVGHISDAVDPHTGFPQFIGHHVGLHWLNSQAIAPQAMGGREHYYQTTYGPAAGGNFIGTGEPAPGVVVVSTVQTTTFSISGQQYNNANSYEWMVAVGQGTSQPGSPFSAYQQPVYTIVSSGTWSAAVPSAVLYAGASGSLGATVTGVQYIPNTSLTLYWQAWRTGGDGLGGQNIYLWARIDGTGQ